MTSSTLKSFFKSTAIVLVVSSLCGLSEYFLNGKFLPYFLLSLAIQYILYFALIDVIRSSFFNKTRQLELQKLENLSTILQCSYCSKKNLVTFFPNQEERIEFDCEHCNKKNLVSLQFIVARTTEPVNTTGLTNVSFLNEKAS